MYLQGAELHLTPIEYKLLCLLAQNVGKVLTHTYITRKIWGNSMESDIASLRVFMATLRKKLEKGGGKKQQGGKKKKGGSGGSGNSSAYMGTKK